jgi:phosphate uptake regulator
MATPVGRPKKFSSKQRTTQKTTVAESVASTEKVVDEAVEKATKKVAEQVTPEFRDKANNIAHKAESFASEVEKIGDEVGKVADSILPTSWGSEWSYHAPFVSKVSRLFIFRCFWIIIQGPITGIWCIWYFIVSIVHYISMFLTGTRNKSLREKQTRFRRHVIAWKSYINALTDKRPAIIVD